ncbi:hypothetical protein BGW36DRAFT_380438 [Talaromyces proteolyticus]|uniref:DNA (cytosine-5)-methyltransferase 1 replication foci domain-containing protein n=1 Tax=Talaromyces proteolyticus TaxID=1131652 RepID=A0AAD4PZA6_9EURO|nr:uncharacterized protein BGW36DRAFT_380438 [Talaromyces proteolyticus]KAH8696202.1 hypothetical protein BGW36DRAFT_380438 [Talaromyces proteolyticus]
MMTSREDQVLKPRDPAVDDENDWEEFSLTDVKILIPGKSRYANLLATTPDNPVRVIGCLDEVEEEQARLVLDDDYLSKRIVIENVTHYAYGQHADGEIGVWVAGQAGWYSIVPAKGYRPMYNDMVEAVDLLYFLVDRHQSQKHRRRAGEPTFEYLCEEYVNHTHGICEDGDDSAEVIDKFHSFLLSQMIQGRENVQWNETEIFKYLAKKFPDEYERILALQQKPDDESPAKRTEPKAIDTHAVSKAQADTIFRIISELKEAGALAKRQLTLDLVTSTLCSRYEIDSDDHAKDVIGANAAAVIEQMERSDYDWHKRAIYRELKQASEKEGIRQTAATPLRPRLGIDDDSSEHESDDEDDPRAQRRRVRKSVLRPISTKKASKKTRSATRDMDVSDDSDIGENLETPSKSRGGHNLVHDPPPSITQTATAIVTPAASINGRARSILSETDSLAIRKTPLQETHQSGNLTGPDLTNLPDDVWACSVQGCGKVIHKASSKRSKELIHDHALTHAEDTQAKIDLVFAEQRLNIGMGVDHLLSRIREFGALEGASVDGDTAVKRIRR